MNEIRQLCANSSSSGEHFDEILALFHACPPQHLLSSLSLICQSISCMSIEQFDLSMINHPLFLLIRQWSGRLLQQWINNGTLNGEEYRSLFYIHQLFKLLSEWLIEQEHRTIEEKEQETTKFVLNNLFLDENFLRIYSNVIEQLINENHDDEERSVSATVATVSHFLDEEDHVSPDEMHMETHTSDVQAERTDVLDVLFRYVNTILNLFNHRIFRGHPMIDQCVRPCIFHCLNSSLFIRLAREFLQQRIVSEKVDIQSIFLLFTCLDFSTLTPIDSSTVQFLSSLRQILTVWNEVSLKTDQEVSPLIIRLIRLILQIALVDSEMIIRENLCSPLIRRFQILCQTSTIHDDFISLLLILCSTVEGKLYLRQLDFLQVLLPETKRQVHLWQLVSLVLTPDEFSQPSLFKRLIHLLMQRTSWIFQSLATASNDTSFDSTTPSTKNQMALIAIDWLSFLRTDFLSYGKIVEEFISSTRKNNFLNLFIDTILSLEQDEELLPKLMEILIELLWTLALSTSSNLHDHLQKRVDLYRWLKNNVSDGTPMIRLASQAILCTLESKSSVREPLSQPNILISMLNADENYSHFCLALRDRLQMEKQYSVEFVLTSSCQSMDSLLHLVNRSSLCLFCVSTRMKSDNLAHFIFRYLAVQSNPIPSLAIVMERECQLDGNWLFDLPPVSNQSILKQMRRHLKDHQRVPSRTSEISSSIGSHYGTEILSDQLPRFLSSPVSQWSTEDVAQWCETKQGTFDSLQPLMSRLNGSALIHLSEILAIDPASMYYRLNDELLQRTGSTLPLTEYVSMSSELERLLNQREQQQQQQKQQEKQLESTTPTPTLHQPTSKRKRRKSSRYCNLF